MLQVCVKGRICVCGDVIQITRFCFYENYWEDKPLTEQKEKEPEDLTLVTRVSLRLPSVTCSWSDYSLVHFLSYS